ncbi:MAG: carbohydrate kinase family protein [Cytophagales bacterium]|nr:carbohydrate kinase family protein [Cytophagales bacterium]
MKKFDILVVGELNVDLILNRIERTPEVGKEVLAEDMALTLGSSSAIFASNASTLGSNVAFVGRVGADSFGDLVIASLKSKGVATQFIRQSTQHSTGATIVLNFDQDRAMVTYPGAMRHLVEQDVSEELLLQSRHLHVSSVFLQTGIRSNLVSLFKRAKALGLSTSIDPQWDPAEQWDLPLQHLLPHVDFFLPNVTELLALTKTRSLHEALATQLSAPCVVVKAGDAGAYLWHNQQLLHQAPFLNTHVVDSIGAGDSFDAGFVHKFLTGGSLPECLEFGALTGAINTTRPGGTGAFGNLEIVKEIARTTFNYTF